MSDIQTGMELERRLASLEKFQWEHEANEGAHAAAFNTHGMSPGPVEDAEQLATDIIDTAVETVEVVPDASIAALGDATEEISDAAQDAIDAITTAGTEAVEAVGEAVPEPESDDEGEGETRNAASPITGDPVKERAPKREHALHRPLFKSNKNEG